MHLPDDLAGQTRRRRLVAPAPAPEYARPATMLEDALSLSVVSLSAIFFVVDPFSAVPFVLAMTRDDAPTKRRETALRASLTAGLVLATSALAGAWIFRMLLQ